MSFKFKLPIKNYLYTSLLAHINGSISIEVQAQSQLAMSGDSLQLSVTVNIQSSSKVGDLQANWQKDGKPVDGSGRIEMSTTTSSNSSQMQFTLKISSSEKSDSGEYSLTIKSDSMSTTISSAKVNVQVMSSESDKISLQILQQNGANIPHHVADKYCSFYRSDFWKVRNRDPQRNSRSCINPDPVRSLVLLNFCSN